MDEHISWQDFDKVSLRCGQIIAAKVNDKAHKPAYILSIDFGSDIGIKTSSAQITQNYTIESLINKKIIAVMNFPAKKIAGVKSEVLVLATICSTKGTLLLGPDANAINGSIVK